MKSTTFKYINRDKQGLLALIPGWAADYRIFGRLNLDSNYLMPARFSPFNFKKPLLNALKKNNIKRLSLFGFSLGGFAAAEFAKEHPDLIEELILVSIRKGYEAKSLEGIKRRIIKSKKGYLYKFYKQCFYTKDDMAWFKKNLLKYYCANLGLDYLLKGLDYLENARIKPELLNNIRKIKIVHGEYDSIAPIAEALDIKNSLANAEFICVKGAGHMPFLKEGFAGHTR